MPSLGLTRLARHGILALSIPRIMYLITDNIRGGRSGGCDLLPYWGRARREMRRATDKPSAYQT